MRIRSAFGAAIAACAALLAGPILATPASAATFEDTSASFTDSTGRESSYRVYGAHLDQGKRSHGIIVYLHGDGAGEHRNPQSDTLDEYAKVAREHGMLMIAPRSPLNDSWWVRSGEPVPVNWLRELMLDAYKRYGVDRNNVWFAGYSGGAEAITYNILPDHGAELVADGGALMVGGGGASGVQLTEPMSDAARKGFPMRWVVGARDDGSNSEDGFNALRASSTGQAFYKDAGHPAVRETVSNGRDLAGNAVPCATHVQSSACGPAALDKMLDAAR